jgi:hypothetical protein
LYTERIDGFVDNIREIDAGFNKYVTLKLDWELEKAKREYDDISDHQTSDEELELEAQRQIARAAGDELTPCSALESVTRKETVKVVSPLFQKANLPDFVTTALKVRSKKTEAEKDPSGAHLVRGPVLRGTSRDPMRNNRKPDAYKGHTEFWRRKMDFRAFE